MKKKDAEKAIRRLVHDWRGQNGNYGEPTGNESFSAFVSWIKETGRSEYLDFRSSISPMYDAELWFDIETRQAGQR